MTGPDVFQSQLRPGERVLWNAPASAAVRDAAHRRSKRRMLLLAVGCAAMASIMAWLAYRDISAMLEQSTLASIFDVAKLTALTALSLYLCVMAVRFYAQDRALHRITSTWHRHYVITDQRVFYVDETGELIDTIERHEIVAAELDEDTSPATVLVERRTDDEEEKHLLLMDLEHPHIANAKIAETFLEPAP
jgi:hypothetical protein